MVQILWITTYKRQFEGSSSGCLILYPFSKEQFDSAIDYYAILQ